ncbi:PAS domain-containing sensor histidine kinase [Agromyces protaetiae]|uniref:histidine kinase n=1 Tax=Agromyces protaetiae TaxID=2509455 RepID=A0A4V0YHH6_9MICO|nr:PAS domain-containing sensor histidine kinase [Agromyces protaetiae]QAY74741.1 PAS domain-containing sensor histidine kinase [Agromyces protaetiae]
MPGSGEPQGRSATFDRSVVLSQLLFGVVLVVVVFTLQLLAASRVTRPEILAGVALAFVTTGVTVFVPWHRLPRSLVMIVPVLDIVAVTLVRVGDPTSGIGLLWVFPTIWLASYFGLRGAVTAIVLTSGAVWGSEIVADREFTPASIAAVVLLPIALVFVATSAYLTSRRARAQRVLLRAQTRQLERALRRANRQEALLADVLDAVDFGVIRQGRDGSGAIMNRSYARLYGLDVGDPDSARDGVAFGEDRATPLLAEALPFNRAAAGEEFDDVVTWVPDGSGGLRALAVTSRRLHDEDGEVDGSVTVARDVTAELRAVRARDDLVASVSHELRTPMTSVLGYVDLSLEDPALPDGVRRNLQIMERNGERMLDLIGAILQGAKQTGGPEPLRREDVDLGEIVVEAVEALRPRSDERGIRVVVTAAEHVRAEVDGFRIRQVVDNLLSNAIKYNRDGGEVAIGATSDGSTAWIVVRDTGIGIPETELPRVFDRFYRADGVRQGTEHGSGLGLGITREIVERHGGTIEIDSEPGSGTTVVVRLPVAGAVGEEGADVS